MKQPLKTDCTHSWRPTSTESAKSGGGNSMESSANQQETMICQSILILLLNSGNQYSKILIFIRVVPPSQTWEGGNIKTRTDNDNFKLK